MPLTKRKDGRWCKSKTINGTRIFFYSSENTERKALRDIENQMIEYTGKVEKGKLKATIKVKNTGNRTYSYIKFATEITNLLNQKYKPEHEYNVVHNTRLYSDDTKSYELKPGEQGECEIDFYIHDKNFEFNSDGDFTASLIEYDSMDVN